MRKFGGIILGIGGDNSYARKHCLVLLRLKSPSVVCGASCWPNVCDTPLYSDSATEEWARSMRYARSLDHELTSLA